MVKPRGHPAAKSRRNPTDEQVRKCPGCGKKVTVEYPRGSTVIVRCPDCRELMLNEEFLP